MMKYVMTLAFFLTPLVVFSHKGSAYSREVRGTAEASSIVTEVESPVRDGVSKKVLAKGHDLTKDEVKDLCKKAMDQKDEFRDNFSDSLQAYIDDKRIKNLDMAYYNIQCGAKRLHQVILDTTGNPGAVKDLFDDFPLPLKDPRGIDSSTVLDSLCVFFSSAKLLQRESLPEGQNCRIRIEKDSDGKTVHPHMNQAWLEAVEFFLKKKVKRGCEIKKPQTCLCAVEEKGKFFVCRNINP